MKTVRDVMRIEFPVVAKDETLEHAVRVMDKYDLDRVVVVKQGRIVGIMTKKDIMMKLATLRTRNVTPGRLHVSSFMTPNPFTITPEKSLKEAASIMLEHGFGSLPVVKGHSLEGLLTRWEIASEARGLQVKVVDVMFTIPESLRTTHKLIHARQLFLKYDVMFMPVLDENNRLVGYITIDEIADAFLAFHDIVPVRFRKERIEKLLVDDVLRPRAPIVNVNDNLGAVIDKIKERKSKGAVVVHKDRVVGIVTLKELVKAYVLYSRD
ncbi:MAG: CBS domain-containing protein [Pyrodictiaceae archaeon]